MARYIFTERNGIYIIDLQKTVKKVDEAYNFVRNLATEGGTMLFVGTKKQAQESVKDEAERCGMYFVNERWLGGMLTNFQTIQKRVDRLRVLERMEAEGVFDVLTKKEVSALRHEMEKLERFLGGIKNMKKIPDALFIVDPRKEAYCGSRSTPFEDSNCCNPWIQTVTQMKSMLSFQRMMMSIRAVKLLTSKMADAIIEGQHSNDEEEEAGEVTEG